MNTPNETALAALNTARATVHASRVEHDTALAQLEAARTKYLADSTAKHQTAVVGAEESARFAEMRMTAATQKFEATKAAHDAHVESEKKAALEARRVAVSHDKFVEECGAAAKKRSELRERLAEVDAEIAARVRGYATEAKACGATAIDYERLAESLTLRASGLNAALVLTRAWAASPVQSMSAEETLLAAERGVSPALVGAKLAA